MGNLKSIWTIIRHRYTAVIVANSEEELLWSIITLKREMNKLNKKPTKKANKKK